MIRTSLCFAALAVTLAVSASAQVPMGSADREAYRAQMKKRMALQARANELRPRRRDAPLRYLNISDNEVREIQQVAEKLIPKSLLNISPVVTGCACEEGPQCTDQVYIIAESGVTSKGLQLSRVNSVWSVGVVQQWWLKNDALVANQKKMTYVKFESALDELYRDFPQCVGELVPAENTTASTSTVESRK